MGLKNSGTQQEYVKREVVRENDLIGVKFLVERVGKSFGGKFGITYPIDVTVEGLGERVYWTSSKVIAKQIEEADGLEGLTLTIVQKESKSGNTYKALEEV